MQSFRDIIDLWPTPDALAAQIGEKAWTVRKWKQRNKIPGEHWMSVAKAACGQGIDVTIEQMAALASREARQ